MIFFFNAKGQPLQVGMLGEETSKSNTKQDLKPFLENRKILKPRAPKANMQSTDFFGLLGCVEVSWQVTVTWCVLSHVPPSLCTKACRLWVLARPIVHLVAVIVMVRSLLSSIFAYVTTRFAFTTMIITHVQDLLHCPFFTVEFLAVPIQMILLIKLSWLVERAKVLKNLALPPLLSLCIFKISFELSIFILQLWINAYFQFFYKKK